MSEFNNGWVEVKRRSQYFAALRSVDIFVDDTKVGVVKNGESKAFELSPGTHSVYAKIDWCQSPANTVTVQAGETTTLYCGSEITGWKILIAGIYMFMPNKTVYLQSAPHDR